MSVGKIDLKLKMSRAYKFPLSLRIPAWAKGGGIKVNGMPVKVAITEGTFFVLDRTFKSGDVVTLTLPMQVKEEMPIAGGISLTRGPLLFSLNIREDKKAITNQDKTSAEFPAWDIKPATPWNYGLSLPKNLPENDVKVITRPLKGFPWLPENSPVSIVVSGRRIPAWQDTLMMPALPKPGAETLKKGSIELVPDGATRIRLSVFPVIKA